MSVMSVIVVIWCGLWRLLGALCLLFSVGVVVIGVGCVLCWSFGL